MNASTSLPNTSAGFNLVNFKELWYVDSTIRGCSTAIAMAVMIGFGIPWATRAVPGQPGLPEGSPELEAAKYAPLFALALGGIALLIMMRRRSFLRNVMANGQVVKATVKKVEMTERENQSDSSMTRTYTRTYWATFNYTLNGKAYSVCQKLPYSPSVCGAHSGREVDLVVLESAPKKPLIKASYVGRA